MTLPNNLINTNRKFSSMWNTIEENKSQIIIQKGQQNIIFKETQKSVPVNIIFNERADLSFDWRDFNILSTTIIGGETLTREAYQGWSIDIVGLNENQVNYLRHNYLIRFGSGEPLLDSNIADDTTVRYLDYVEIKDNVITFYYGFLISDTEGVQEIDEDGMQIKLNLTLINPNYYN